MEEQSVSLLRRKNRWGLTILSIVLCVLLMPVISFSVLMPQVVTYLPVVLLLLFGYVGPVSALTCAALLIGASLALFGMWGALCTSLFLVPVLAVSILVTQQRRPFFVGVGVSSAAVFIAMELVMVALSAIAGTDIVSALTGLLEQAFSSLGALIDPMLAALVHLGILAAPEGFDIAAENAATAVLDPQMREEMIRSIVYSLDSGLRLELPAQMVRGALTMGLFGQAVLRSGLVRQGVEVPVQRMRTWHVPSGWGRVLGITLLVFFAGAMLLPNQLTGAYYVFGSLFEEVFKLQGIAAACYVLHKRGAHKGWQAAVFLVGYFMLGTAAILLGIADQAMDFSHRREELEKKDNPFDPFGRKPQA